MRRCSFVVDRSVWRAALMAGVLLLPAGLCLGQELDLPTPLVPPAPVGPTVWQRMVATLVEEIDALAREERGADEMRKVVLRVSINHRIVAMELLEQGDRGGQAGSTSAITGLAIFQARKDLDAVLAAIPEEATAIVPALRKFNDAVVDFAPSVRTTDPHALDANLPRIFAPLAAAVSNRLDRTVSSHWPTRRQVAGGPQGAVPTTREAGAARGGRVPATVLDELERRLADVALDEGTARQIETILGYLRRGARFSELRGDVERILVDVEGALDFADTLAGADWIDGPAATAYRDRLRLALIEIADPDRRDAGRNRLGGLAISGSIIDGVTVLRRRGADTRTIWAAFSAWDDGERDLTVESRPVAELGRVLERMTVFRGLETRGLPRDLATTARKLSRAYEAAEAKVVGRIETVLLDPRWRSDPDFTSLLADQNQLLQDIERVVALPDRLQRLGGAHPEAAVELSVRARRVAQLLLDPARRAEAVGAMTRLEALDTEYSPLPFEAALGEARPAAVVSTGGLHAELLALVRSTRREWIETWGRPPSPAAVRMKLFRRLTLSMAGAAELTRLEDDPSVLNRWAAWQMPDGLLRRGVSDLTNRLKLATAALIRGDDRAAADELDKIDREVGLASLVGRLVVRLGDVLAALPEDPLSVLGQLIHAPPDDAWMPGDRTDLADLCRYAVELDDAWREGRESEELEAFVNALAGRLLEGM